jgi:quinol monooxygenase YgiN
MIVVTGTVQFPKGGLDQIMPAAREMMRESRLEDGCILYVYARDLVDPDLMHVSEKWRDRETLSAHFETDHMKRWRAALADIPMIARDLLAFETDEGAPI